MTEDTTIFYSWQSDNSKTRAFVEKALKNAVKNIADNPNIEMAPRVDKDTQETAGAVHIVDTIKKKIEVCGVFLADVSLIDTSKLGRSLVNQNVMFELGYAIGKHTESRVIMVANTDLGDTKNLPFDISHHRVIQFSPKSDTKGTTLQAALESALSIHLTNLKTERSLLESEASKDGLINAIENNKPTRSLASRYIEVTYSKYLQLSPGRFKGGNIQHYGAAVYEAYVKTKQITVELFDVIEKAAEYHNEALLLQLYKQVEKITKYYDVVDEDNGQMFDTSKEFPVLVTIEIVSLILGCMAQEKMWATLHEISDTKLKRSSNYTDTRGIDRLYAYPNAMYDHFNRLKGVQYIIPMTKILEERFDDQPRMLQAYVDGNIMCYFLHNSYPWTVGFLLQNTWIQFVPEFISQFKKASFCSEIMKVTKEATVEEFRKNIWEQAAKEFGNWNFYNDNLVPAFKHAGVDSQARISSVS